MTDGPRALSTIVLQPTWSISANPASRSPGTVAPANKSGTST
jgi:hypothetical protein